MAFVRSLHWELLLAVGWGLCAQGIFLLIQNIQAQHASAMTRAQFKVSQGINSSFAELGEAIEELERLGILKCSNLIYQVDPPTSVINTSFRNVCPSLPVFLDGQKIDIPLQTTNGSQFRLIAFTVNGAAFYLALWLMRFFGWGGIILFRLYMRQKELLHRTELRSAEDLHRISAQVAHDIRSPLAALDVVWATLTGIPEDKRGLVRSSISRINDIANNLLNQNVKPQSSTEARRASTQLVPVVVDALISEKRLQFRGFPNVEIDYRIQAQAYGLFSTIDAGEFKRVLSNLINNSVEALPNKTGLVGVSLRKHGSCLRIEITDNGKGIPAHILPLLGREGKTFGKEGGGSGSGLGLYHAMATIEAWGGSVKIKSLEGTGTTVMIELAAAAPPGWFVSEIDISSATQVVVIDDEASIHRIWRERFESMNRGIRVLHFVGADDLKAWSATRSAKEQILFLVDYDLLLPTQSGLDLIETLGIVGQSILVTSRYDEVQVCERVERLRLRMIPKGMAGFTPIKVAKLARKATILIDNDELVLMTWKMAANEQCVDLATFSGAIAESCGWTQDAAPC